MRGRSTHLERRLRSVDSPRAVPSELHTYALGDVQCARVPLLHEKYVQSVRMVRQRVVRAASWSGESPVYAS